VTVADAVALHSALPVPADASTVFVVDSLTNARAVSVVDSPGASDAIGLPVTVPSLSSSTATLATGDVPLFVIL
jgi:hypothetical protein